MNEISLKQLEANRQNAKLGGVKTEEGKTLSKYNALKHGILTDNIILHGESKTKLINFSRRIKIELKPANEMELVLVERIIANTWRLRRALKAEKEMIEHNTKDKKTFGAALSYDFANYDSYGKFTRYETSLEKGIYKALHELQRIQAVRFGEKLPAPIVVDVDISNE